MRRLWTALVGLAAVAALIAVPAALAKGYTSPKLSVTQAGGTTAIAVSASPAEDHTARLVTYSPPGGSPTLSQAAGTTLGNVKATAVALALGGATLELAGKVEVRSADGTYSAGGQTLKLANASMSCTGTTTHSAYWVLSLTTAGQTLDVPMFVDVTQGPEAAIGASKMTTCLAPPDIPVENGGAPFGATLVSATYTLSGVFSPMPGSVWISIWTPWVPGAVPPKVNAQATVVAPAAVVPGAVSISAKKAGLGAIVTGRVTQAGQGRGGSAVTIFGGLNKTRLKKLGAVKVTSNGAFTFRTRRGVFFRANAVAASTAAAPLCPTIAPLLTALGTVLGATPPCVNPTVNGFTAPSRTVKKK